MALNSTQEDPAPAINHALTIALTGGIASGKTLISDEFARLGVPVIDTDVIARIVVEPGMPALREIEQAMGSQFTDKKGWLDRSRLRVLIFSDPEARQNLESILHPRIRQAVSEASKEVTSAYCIVVIPLLAEKGTYPNLNRVLVVDVEPETQIARLKTRDNYNRQQAKQALQAQASRAQRLKIADDILDNSGSPSQARKKVAQLHLKYKKLAANQ